MKKGLLFRLSLLLVSALFPQNSFAQDYTQWSLPDGAKARLSKGRQHDIAYSPDGTQIAIGSSIGIWLYGAHTGVELALLTGHTGIVLSVAYSPDGRTLAGGGGWRDGTIRLWDAATGRHKHILEGHTEGVTSMAFSPDGNTLANGNYKEIWLWDVTTGEHKQTLEGHTDWVLSVVYSPDGGTLASGGWDDTIQLWDANTGERKQTLEGHTDSVNSIAFSPDGRTLASGADRRTKRFGCGMPPPENISKPLRDIDAGSGRSRFRLMEAPSLAQVGMARFGCGMLPPESTNRPLRGIRTVNIRSHIHRMATPSSVGVLERYICGRSPPAAMNRFSKATPVV